MGRREFEYDDSTWALYAESRGGNSWIWWVELVLPEEESIVSQPQLCSASELDTEDSDSFDALAFWLTAGTPQERAVLQLAEQWVRANANRVLQDESTLSTIIVH